MSETKVRRRGFGDDGIYLDAAMNPYMGAVSIGYGPDRKRIRRKVSGKTRQEVRAKLQALHEELNAGIRSSSTYTAREAVDDWLREGLDGTSERTHTLYEGLLEPVLEGIGARLLRDLGARDVRSALSQLATRYSTRSLQITWNSLERAIRHAESNDLVGRNVAALVKTPQGRNGRSLKSLTLCRRPARHPRRRRRDRPGHRRQADLRDDEPAVPGRHRQARAHVHLPADRAGMGQPRLHRPGGLVNA
jgi:hypothetical protein